MNKVKIFNNTYKIIKREFSDVEKNQCLGYCFPDKKEIHINKELDKDLYRETLAHEVTHAYLAEISWRNVQFENEQKLEEYICDTAAKVCYLMKDYKEF